MEGGFLNSLIITVFCAFTSGECANLVTNQFTQEIILDFSDTSVHNIRPYGRNQADISSLGILKIRYLDPMERSLRDKLRNEGPGLGLGGSSQKIYLAKVKEYFDPIFKQKFSIDLSHLSSLTVGGLNRTFPRINQSFIKALKIAKRAGNLNGNLLNVVQKLVVGKVRERLSTISPREPNFDSPTASNSNCPQPSVGYNISGTVSNLPIGSQITLRNNGVDEQEVVGNGSVRNFQFSQYASGSNYNITITDIDRAGNRITGCNITNEKGRIANAHRTNITVDCDPIVYSVSGVIHGLRYDNKDYGVVLNLETPPGFFASSTRHSGNGSFHFAQQIPVDVRYRIRVERADYDVFNCSSRDGVVGASNIHVSIGCSPKPGTCVRHNEAWFRLYTHGWFRHKYCTSHNENVCALTRFGVNDSGSLTNYYQGNRTYPSTCTIFGISCRRYFAQ